MIDEGIHKRDDLIEIVLALAYLSTSELSELSSLVPSVNQAEAFSSLGSLD